MCNCFLYLQKLISHTKKIILVLLLQLTVLSFTAAVDYFWTGNSGTDKNWTTAANWSNTLGGAPAADYPRTASDNALFPRADTIQLDSDVTVALISIPNPNEATSDFTVTVTGTNKITAAKIENVRAAAPGAGTTAKSKFVFDCDVQTPALFCHSGADYEITSGHTAEITNFNFITMDLVSIFTVNGTLKTGKDLKLFDTGDFYKQQIKIDPSSTGTLETSGNLSVESEFQTDSLEIKCNNLVTKETFKCKRIDVSGTTEIHKWFITDSSGVTSTFAGTVTTKGSSGNQILILDHSGATPCSIPLAIENTGGTLILHNSEIEVTGSNIDSGASSYELKINVPVTFTGNPVIQNASKVVFDAGCTSVSGSGTKSFNTDVEIVGTVALNPDIIVSGNFTDGGTVSGTGKITLNGNSTSGKKDQTFAASATSNYGTIVINKTEGKVDFNSSNTLKATKITVSQSEETDFTGKFEVPEIETNSSSGIIDFKTSDGKINGDFTAASQTKVSSGKLTITGDFVNNADLQIASGASLCVKGSVDDSSGTNWTGTGKLVFNGNADQTFTACANRNYASVEAALTGAQLTVNNDLELSAFKLTSGSVEFTDKVTFSSYSDTAAGKLYFDDEVNFGTGGTVLINASETGLKKKLTSAKPVNIRGTLVTKTEDAEIEAPEITINSIKTDTAGSNFLKLISTTGKFNLGQIGEAAKKLNKISLDSGNNPFVFTYTSTDTIYSNILELTNNNKDISLTGLNWNDELQLNTTNEVSLNGNANPFTVRKLTFLAVPSKIKLAKEIKVTGTDGFVIPAAHPELVLTDNTTITTTNASAPITLYDNIAGSKALTINNAGPFNLSDVTSGADPADKSTSPVSSATLTSFTQSGAGLNNISGDINASGAVSFGKGITLGGNVSLISTGNNVTLSASVTDSGSNLLVIKTGSGNKFTAGNSITATAGIYITGSSDFRNTSTVTGNLEITGTHTTVGNVTYSDSVKITGDSVVNAGGTAVFSDQLEVSQNLTVNGTATFNASVTVTGNETVSGNATHSESVEVTGNYENKSGAVTTIKKELKLNGNFTDNGTFANTVAAAQIQLSGTNNQQFNANAANTYKSIKIDKNSGTVTFNNNVNITGIDVSKAAFVTFNSSAAIGTYTDSAVAGNITFIEGCKISSGTEFKTTGTVQFGSSAGAGSGKTSEFTSTPAGTYYNVTHEAGTTKVYGNFIAGRAVFGELVAYEGVVFDSECELKENVTADSGSYIRFNKAVEFAGGKSVAGNIMFGGNVGGSGNTSFTDNLYLFGDSSLFGLAGQKLTVTGNVITAKNLNKNAECAAEIQCDNFVLYSGNLIIKENVTTQKDMVLLGARFSEKDEQTGFEIYKYADNRYAGWSQAQYPSASPGTWETTFPDGTSFPVTPLAFGGNLKVNENIILHVGKNFYANGLDMSLNTGTGNWYIDILENAVASNCFAETYNCNVDHSTVRCHTGSGTTGVSNPLKSQVVFEAGINAGVCDPSCVNFDSEVPEITKAYTVRDNAVRIEFNKPLRKIEDVTLLKWGNGSFTPDVYSDPDCAAGTEITGNITSSYFDGVSDQYYFYLKADGTWNTDATGKTPGLPLSTDRNGSHKNTLPYIDLPRSLGTKNAVVTDLFGKRSKNYSTRSTISGIAYGSPADLVNDVPDKAGPVLIQVKTGQENHTPYDAAVGKDSQKSYDAHNFIEFRYSEQVNFGSSNAGICSIWLPYDDLTTAENVQVAHNFGAVEGNFSEKGTLQLAGIAKFDRGQMYTGSKGSPDKTVNALYRFDDYSLRYSLAGYTEGTLRDSNNNEHKKWKGYVYSSEIPSGSVSVGTSDNQLITDANMNHQTMVKPGLTVDSSSSGIFGEWDSSKPVFAPLRMRASTPWGNTDYYEALGNNEGSGSTLDRIEFHLFDNTPKYDSSDEAMWYSERGWCVDDGSEEPPLKTEDSYSADIFGGSRQFAITDRTSGGIRFSSLEEATKAFRYSTDHASTPETQFDNSKPPIVGAKGAIFTGNSALRRSATEMEGLYFGIPLADKTLSVNSTFKIAYDSSQAWITDLAGNLLESETIKTLDRTAPNFNLILSPVNQKEMFISFVKHLNLDNIRLYDNSGSVIPVSEDFSELIPKCFEIIALDENAFPVQPDIQIDTSVPAQKVEISESEQFTAIKLTLTRDITLNDVKTLYIRVKNPDNYNYTMSDPVTNIANSNVTLIQDDIGNYIELYKAHTLSDLAINTVEPLYAYNSSMNYNGQNIMDGLYEEGSWAVRNFNADQQNYGTLIAENSISVVADVDNQSKENNHFDGYLRLYLSNKPDEESVSKKFNTEIGGALRIWLPAVTDSILSGIALENNKNFLFTDSQQIKNDSVSSGFIFNLSKEQVEQWNGGDQVSFLFGYMNPDGTPYTQYIGPVYDINTGSYDLSISSRYPLFAVRLLSADLLSLDLWSFRLKSLIEQRGGVTVLNNVINASRGEKAAVKVNIPVAGKLNVMVMTLDGNIVTYLNRSTVSAGEHYFTWNGRNMNGTPVARGMYFIRVAGSNIDETRKVMVVKD